VPVPHRNPASRAAQMLGTRRSSVTVAAGMLAKAGLIAHSRDDIEIIDRKKLEEQPVSYGLMQRQVKALQGDARPSFVRRRTYQCS
jgi:Crp-like helix-turn-helix domain